MNRALAWVLAAALLGHGLGLANGFVYDDHRFVRENPALLTLTPTAALLDASTHTADADRDVYRPLRALGHAFDLRAWGPDPFGFHLHSLLAQLLAVTLAWALLRALFGDVAAATGAGLLAVHPAGVEVAGWISSRGDQYALIGTLATLWLLLPERRGRARVLALCAAALLAGLATLGKESAAVVPGIVLLHDLVLRSRRRVLEPLSAALGVAAAVCLRQLALDGASPIQVPPHGGSAVTQVGWALYGLARLAEHLVLPSQLSIDPPQELWARGGGVFLRPLTWVGAALLAAPLLLWRRRPQLAFLTGWALLAWLPSGSLLVTLRTLVTDRAAYPLLAPLGACLGLLIAERRRRAGQGLKLPVAASCGPGEGSAPVSCTWRRRASRVGVGLLLALALVCARRTQVFRSDQTLWTNALLQNPDPVRARLGLAMSATSTDQATALLEQAVAAAPPRSKQRAAALARLGDHLLAVVGDPGAASVVLAQAVAALQHWARVEGRASDDLPASIGSLAEALDRLGRHAEAESVLRAAAAASARPAPLILKWALLQRVRADATQDRALAARAEQTLAEAEALAPDDPLVRAVRSRW